MNVTLYIFAKLSSISPDSLPHPDANSGSITDIKNIVLGIAGGLALLIIVASGIRYIVSAGDPQKTAKAKDGIIYALVGLLLIIIADAIVSFVVKRL